LANVNEMTLFCGLQPAGAIPPTAPMTLPSEWRGKTRFDAIAFLPRAQKLARQLMPDAVLTQFEVEAVHPDPSA
jgi:hypothetical protein